MQAADKAAFPDTTQVPISANQYVQPKPQNGSPTIPMNTHPTPAETQVTNRAMINGTVIDIDEKGMVQQNPLIPATPNELNSLSPASDQDIALMGH
jgi:hypothetical protein